MRLSEVRLHRPRSLEQAYLMVRDLDPATRFLAGGTDMLVDLKLGRSSARNLILLDGVAELHGIDMDGDVLRIGAGATMAEIVASDAVRRHAPAFAESARTVGSAQIRNRATIGGNFCAAVPCADMPPMCIALSGRLRLAGPGGRRELAAEDFFAGPRATVLSSGEILTEILIPEPPPRSGASYQRFGRRTFTSLAVAGAAAFVALQEDSVSNARIALTSVAPVPLFARAASDLLAGAPVSDRLLDAAARTAAEEARPITDMRGSAAFRRDLVATLVRRGLDAAIAAARGER
jgi:carbon-monoxide dehydrogenase medium subunit